MFYDSGISQPEHTRTIAKPGSANSETVPQLNRTIYSRVQVCQLFFPTDTEEPRGGGLATRPTPWHAGTGGWNPTGRWCRRRRRWPGHGRAQIKGYKICMYIQCSSICAIPCGRCSQPPSLSPRRACFFCFVISCVLLLCVARSVRVIFVRVSVLVDVHLAILLCVRVRVRNAK